MSEVIANWSGWIATASFVVMFTAWTVEAIALGNAGYAAFASPFAVIGWLAIAVKAIEAMV